MAFLLMLVGCNFAFSERDAPFELGLLRGQVWSTDPDSRYGHSAVLVLSDTELPCGTFNSNFEGALDEAIGAGKGVMFILENDTEEGASADWEGLWMPGYGYGPGGQDREMYALTFVDGFVYYDMASYYGIGSDSTWLQIDVAGEQVSGSFRTSNWHGGFDAEDCGDWDERTDSWYDTDGWEDTTW